jgi:hypothetical protein
VTVILGVDPEAAGDDNFCWRMKSGGSHGKLPLFPDVGGGRLEIVLVCIIFVFFERKWMKWLLINTREIIVDNSVRVILSLNVSVKITIKPK